MEEVQRVSPKSIVKELDKEQIMIRLQQVIATKKRSEFGSDLASLGIMTVDGRTKRREKGCKRAQLNTVVGNCVWERNYFVPHPQCPKATLEKQAENFTYIPAC